MENRKTKTNIKECEIVSIEWKENVNKDGTKTEKFS